MQPDTPFSAKVHEFFKPRRSAAGVSPAPAAHATAPRTARAEAPKRRRRGHAAERAPSPQSPECTVEDLEAALHHEEAARPTAATPVHVDDGSKAQDCAVDSVDDKDTDVGRFLKECLAQKVSENDTSPLDKLLRQARQDAEQPASPEAVDEAVRKAALTGELGLRDKIGQNFARRHAKGTDAHAAYQACESRDDKRRGRAAWAKEFYKDCVLTKSNGESFSQVDTTLGVMMPFGQLVQSYGGGGGGGRWAPAVQGAKLHAAKAAKMGGRWCQVDSMSELMHFLKLEKNYAEIMEHKWSLFTAWSAKVDAGDNGAEVSPTMRGSALATKAIEHDAKASTNAASLDDRAKQAPRTSAVEGKPVKRKTPNQCDTNGDDDEPKNKVSPLKKKLIATLKEAQRVKNLFLMASTKAQQFLDQVDSQDPSYGWATSDKVAGKLREHKAMVVAKLQAFDKEFTLHELVAIKAKYAEERLLEHLDEFIQHKVAFNGLLRATEKLLKMHQQMTE
jgi:hypothetical protein